MRNLKPYNLGLFGIEQCAGAEIDHSVAANGASEGTVDLITLPAGCVITKTLVNVTEAFNASSNALTVGMDASASDLVAAADIDETALGVQGKSAPVLKKTDEAVTIKAKYTQAGDPAATAGHAEVMVFFTRVE